MSKCIISMNALETSRGDNAFDIIELNYDADMNYMVDECGKIVYDIHRIISPGRLMVFKDHKQTTTTWADDGTLILLKYPDEKGYYDC